MDAQPGPTGEEDAYRPSRAQSAAAVSLLPGRLPEGARATAAAAGHGMDGISVDIVTARGMVNVYLDTTFTDQDEDGFDGRLRLYVTGEDGSVCYDRDWETPPSPRPSDPPEQLAAWVSAVTSLVVLACLDGSLEEHRV